MEEDGELREKRRGGESRRECGSGIMNVRREEGCSGRTNNTRRPARVCCSVLYVVQRIKLLVNRNSFSLS